MDCKKLIEILSALLTPTIALITTYIAFQQYRIQKLQQRHELYDRRLAIFNSTMDFIAVVVREAKVQPALLYKFYADRNESWFLFDKDVSKHLDELHNKAADFYGVHKSLEKADLSLEERRELGRKDTALLLWFTDQFEVTRERFAKYLSVKSMK